MKIPIPGNARLVIPIESVDVSTPTFSLDDSEDDFTIPYAFNYADETGRVAAFRTTIIVTKAQIVADAGKPFDQCTKANISRAIKRSVVADVKAKL